MNTYAQVNTTSSRSNVICDLRSDTVTQPCKSMRRAMAEAEVGDDVYGDDPSVTRLEQDLAGRLGKASGLFLPSGTQSNLSAAMAHCGRGEEIIVGSDYHLFVDEAKGASVLASIALQPLPVSEDGALEPDDVANAIQPDDSHCAITRMLSLENTCSGRAVPLDRIAAPVAVARSNGLSVHLDGARFFNAVTALGCAPEELAGHADTISVCLSKGLGAPVGSVLVGNADLIACARRVRKMLGGGMRQAGVLAAAGLFALEEVLPKLAQDHARAEVLAAALSDMHAGDVEQATNMVFLTPRNGDAGALHAHMAGQGVLIGGQSPRIRMVLHRDVTDNGLKAVIEGFRVYFAA
jgi:threonine aldolase